MMISKSKIYHFPCSECGVNVKAEIWFVLEQDERPQLWKKCLNDTLNISKCINGHIRKINTNILLCDKNSNQIIYSPTLKANDFIKIEENELMDTLKLSLQDNFFNNPQIQTIPHEFLYFYLSSGKFKIHEFAPGIEITNEIEDLYYHCGKLNDDQLIEFISSEKLEPSLKAALQFEIAIRLIDKGLIDESIRQYKNALEFYSKNIFPKRWAMIQSDLAICYRNRNIGNKKINLNEALNYSILALSVVTNNNYPEEYARIQKTLGNIYLDYADKEITTIEKAILAFQESLTIYNYESYAEDWSLVQMNLATAFLERGIDNDIQTSISCFENSLLVQTKETSELSWALTQLNLGAAYSRFSHNSEDIKFKSIDAFRKAVAVFKKLDESEYLLPAEFNLGMMLCNLNNSQYLKESVELLIKCKNLYTVEGKNIQIQAAIGYISEALIHWLELESNAQKRYEICNLAFENLLDEEEIEIVGGLFFKIAIFLIEYASIIGDNKKIYYAEKAIKKTLSVWKNKHQLENRAKALVLLGTIYSYSIYQNDSSYRLTARTCLNEALNILNKFESNSNRLEIEGEIHILVSLLDNNIPIDFQEMK